MSACISFSPGIIQSKKALIEEPLFSMTFHASTVFYTLYRVDSCASALDTYYRSHRHVFQFSDAE
jgi:hypothetical protein